MWLFLATEILFFGGLFVAYSVYRFNHPEVFIFGHHFLDKSLGALNTVILICSSLTAAWAVRAAQLKQNRVLKLMLVLTILLAFGFLGVKAVEYNSKWKHGLLWARQYNPHIDHEEPAEVLISDEGFETGTVEGVFEEVTVLQEVGDAVLGETDTIVVEEAPVAAPAGDADRSKIAPAAEGPAGLAAPAAEESSEKDHRDRARQRPDLLLDLLPDDRFARDPRRGGNRGVPLAVLRSPPRLFLDRPLHPRGHGGALLARCGSDLDLPLPAPVPHRIGESL